MRKERPQHQRHAPFIHPLSTAVGRPGARSDWEIYKGFAKAVSEVSVGHLGVEKDVVLTPIMHDTPAEMAQPYGVRDWKKGKWPSFRARRRRKSRSSSATIPNLFKRFTAWAR